MKGDHEERREDGERPGGAGEEKSESGRGAGEKPSENPGAGRAKPSRAPTPPTPGPEPPDPGWPKGEEPMMVEKQRRAAATDTAEPAEGGLTARRGPLVASSALIRQWWKKKKKEEKQETETGRKKDKSIKGRGGNRGPDTESGAEGMRRNCVWREQVENGRTYLHELVFGNPSSPTVARDSPSQPDSRTASRAC